MMQKIQSSLIESDVTRLGNPDYKRDAQSRSTIMLLSSAISAERFRNVGSSRLERRIEEKASPGSIGAPHHDWNAGTEGRMATG